MWLTNVKIWDGVSDQLHEQTSICIEGSKIVSLGGSPSEAVSDCDVMDCQGMTVIPGLIDAHVHMCLNPDIKDPFEQDRFTDQELIDQIAARALTMLRAGITSARDLGGGRWLELKVRDLINEGALVGTRLVCAGQPVTSVNGHCHFWGGEADSPEAASQVIQRQIAHNVDLIKIMATGGSITPGSTPANSQFSAEEMNSMVTQAKSEGYRVAAHCHGTEGIDRAAGAGVTTIEHCSWVGEEGWARDYSQTVVEKIVAQDVWVSPTISVGWKRYYGTKTFEGLIRNNYEKMKSAGIKLIASTDCGIPGVHHQDLPKAIPVFAYFAGLNPAEALRAATSDCAEAVGLGHIVGRIEVGYDADLVLYEGNPLDDLEVLETPKVVISRGKQVA